MYKYSANRDREIIMAERDRGDGVVEMRERERERERERVPQPTRVMIELLVEFSVADYDVGNLVLSTYTQFALLRRWQRCISACFIRGCGV